MPSVELAALWGGGALVLAGVLYLADLLLREAVKKALAKVFDRKPAEPIETDLGYADRQKVYAPACLRWSATHKCSNWEAQGYTYFIDPGAKARVMTPSVNGARLVLMVKPGAKKL